MSPSTKKSCHPGRRIRVIPADREKIKEQGEFFGRSFLQEIPFYDKGMIVYSVKKPDFTLEYRFNKTKAAQLKDLLRFDNSKDFSLGRRASRLWYSLIVLAAEQGQGISGTVSISDIARLWNCKKSGRLYDDIKQSFISLASFNPRYTNNKNGAEYTEWGYTFFEAWRIKGEGDQATFSFSLNKMALGVTTEWLNDGKLSIKSLKSGYVSIPITQLQNNRLDPRYENFLERLRLVRPGQIIKVKFYTVLDEWIKTGSDFLKHRKKCYDLVVKYCQQAQKDGELLSFKTQVLTNTNWRENWMLIIEK